MWQRGRRKSRRWSRSSRCRGNPPPSSWQFQHLDTTIVFFFSSSFSSEYFHYHWFFIHLWASDTVVPLESSLQNQGTVQWQPECVLSQCIMVCCFYCFYCFVVLLFCPNSVYVLLFCCFEVCLCFVVGNLLEKYRDPTEGHGCEVDDQECTWNKLLSIDMKIKFLLLFYQCRTKPWIC